MTWGGVGGVIIIEILPCPSAPPFLPHSPPHLCQDQYVFIHDALFDHIVCGDTSIPASSLKTALHDLTLVDPKKGVSDLHLEYEVRNGGCR